MVGVAGEYSSVIELTSGHANARPDALVATYGNKHLTYGQLESQSSRLAVLLRTRGVQKGDRVAVLTTRCLEMPVLFCAVLRTGACYVPLDLDDLSNSRIAHVIQDVQPTIALTTKSGLEVDCPVLCWNEAHGIVNDVLLQTNSEIFESEVRVLRPDDLAYIVYTSGTTSSPKGVMIPHSALLNYVQQGDSNAPFNMRVSESDNVLSVFSPAFDGRHSGFLFSDLYLTMTSLYRCNIFNNLPWRNIGHRRYRKLCLKH